MEANKVNLPLIKKMLDEVAEDASTLAMDKEELMEEFMIAYQDTLLEIGLDNREIAKNGYGCDSLDFSFFISHLLIISFSI